MFHKLFGNEDHEDHPLLGIICGVIAFFLIALVMALAKALSSEISAIAIAFYRNVIGLALFTLFLALSGRMKQLKTARPRAHIVRGIVGTVGMILTFAAFSLLSMSQTTVLLFSSSLMLPLFGVVLLKESVGPYRWAAILIGFGGVIIAAQPDTTITTMGVTIALMAAVSHALVGICLRWLGSSEGALTTSFYFMLTGTVVTLPAVFLLDIALPANMIWMVFCIGLFAMLAQIFLSGAFKFAPPASISPLNYTGLIWAALLDMVFWDILPPGTVFSGGFIIIASNLFIAWREKRSKKTVL